MITGLDHVVVLVSDIEAAAAGYQTLFARSPAWRNTSDGAARVLFTLDNVTLELMSPDGDGTAADRIRAVIAEQGEGLASICFRTRDIERMHRRLDRLTLQSGADCRGRKSRRDVGRHAILEANPGCDHRYARGPGVFP